MAYLGSFPCQLRHCHGVLFQTPFNLGSQMRIVIDLTTASDSVRRQFEEPMLESTLDSIREAVKDPHAIVSVIRPPHAVGRREHSRRPFPTGVRAFFELT